MRDRFTVDLDVGETSAPRDVILGLVPRIYLPSRKIESLQILGTSARITEERFSAAYYRLFFALLSNGLSEPR